MQARADAGLVEQVDRHLLEHARADAAEHVFGAALLEDDVRRCPPVQQLAEQQTGGAGADDRDLDSHRAILGKIGVRALFPRETRSLRK